MALYRSSQFRQPDLLISPRSLSEVELSFLLEPGTRFVSHASKSLPSGFA